VVADINVLRDRAAILGKDIFFNEYLANKEINSKDTLSVIHVPCVNKVTPGVLDAANAKYVVEMLHVAAKRTLSREFAGVITAPVHKGIINKSGINFTGHTEFFADFCGVDKVVMMLSSPINCLKESLWSLYGETNDTNARPPLLCMKCARCCANSTFFLRPASE
jgi:4-hydroxythreonine-4-phosphate dehydrogenase